MEHAEQLARKEYNDTAKWIEGILLCQYSKLIHKQPQNEKEISERLIALDQHSEYVRWLNGLEDFKELMREPTLEEMRAERDALENEVNDAD